MNDYDAPATTGYMLLFRGEDWDRGMTDQQLQSTIDEVMAWFNSVLESGKVKGGQPLARQGKTVSGRNAIVADGPFAESKEAVGGYLILDVASEEEAVAIARTCPTLKYDITIEVRPLLEDCPVFRRARKRMEFAA